MNSENNRSNTLTIDTASLLLDLRRHWWNIVLMAIAGCMLTYVWMSNFAAPTYRSSAVLAVLGNSGSSVSNIQNASRISGSIVNVFASEAFREIVTDEVGTSDYGLSASYIADTNFISVSASASTPQEAFRTLKTALEQYPALLSNLMSDVYIVDVQKAEIPMQPSNPIRMSHRVVIGGAFFAALYVAVILLLSVLRETVKNVSDMRHKVDTRLLGVIPYIKTRRGSGNWLLATEQTKNFRFEESYQLMASRVLSHMEARHCKTLAMTSVLQNEGKTHCILNIAYSLAKSQKKVLVIDADFRNPSVAKLLSIDDRFARSLSTAMKTGSFTQDMLYQIPGSEVYCLTNHARHSISAQTLSNGKFQQILKHAAQSFDCVLVDTGPMALVSDTPVIAAQCDASILLVAQDTTVVRAINDAVDVLNRSRKLIGCIYRETRPSKHKAKSYGYGFAYGYGTGKSKTGGNA